jgi:lysophospholipase L1-like esterase
MNRVLALGDSYTIGEAVAPDQRWVEQWAALLRADGRAIAQPVTVIAKTGWTGDELLQGIQEHGPLTQFDLVTLLIGVNNQYRGHSVDDYRKQFAELLAIANRAGGDRAGRVQVLSIPDWGQTPFGRLSGRDLCAVSTEIDAFNTAAESLCQALGVAFLDITGLTREHHDDPAMHAADGLHPSAAMYGLWAGALLCTGTFGRL